MKLGLTYSELSDLYGVKLNPSTQLIQQVSYDTRRLINPSETLFFAFKGEFRDGHDFISSAYEQGVRAFVVSQLPSVLYDNAAFIKVEDVLVALQKLATYHRSKFTCEVIGITGSAGKTSVKEILGMLLADRYHVVRSPKSFNSQIGVAISLLEITSETEIALIEAGISKPGEMTLLRNMIKPTIGILTSIGTAHIHNFKDQSELLAEKLKLFDPLKPLFKGKETIVFGFNSRSCDVTKFDDLWSELSFEGVMRSNAALAMEVALHFGMTKYEILKRLRDFKPIAMRMEAFDGIRNSIIINDTYNLDREALIASLHYQKSIAKGKKRILYVGTRVEDQKKMVTEVARQFAPLSVYFHDEIKPEELALDNGVLLIKGDRSLKMEQVAAKLRQFKHETSLEIDLSAVRSNINFLKKDLPQETKILAMVKASSYGSGAENLALFLERTGINYLGVAYPDEGAELRKVGVKLPIMVMNVDRASFGYCIENRLEPAIFHIDQLDEFIKELIYRDELAYPIHIKLETGMNRLGFNLAELKDLLDLLQAQPEVRVQSVYSHLSSADEIDSPEVHAQVQRFKKMSQTILEELNYPVIRHILNSEGIINFPMYHFDMVRIGIAMYGITSNRVIKKQLKPVIKWQTTVSQVKQVEAGEGIGYNGRGKLNSKGEIAVIPVGYADGFRRSLGNGVGGVFIHESYCPIVGNVCMDMIMVDVSGLNVKKGDNVEIIGPHQTIEALAIKMETIPYEVLTGISKRVHRVYIED